MYTTLRNMQNISNNQNRLHVCLRLRYKKNFITFQESLLVKMISSTIDLILINKGISKIIFLRKEIYHFRNLIQIKKRK